MILKTTQRLDAKSIARILAVKHHVPAEEAARYNFASGEKEARDSAQRSTTVYWLPADQHPEIVLQLVDIMRQHRQVLALPVGVGIEKSVQLATYRVGDHFTWHHDGTLADASKRVASMSVLLNDDFDGGRLEFRSPGAPKLKKPGDVILFHSNEVHRVTPVTRGTRDALVAWFGLQSP
jgi:PKHD-type hydroxylase